MNKHTIEQLLDMAEGSCVLEYSKRSSCTLADVLVARKAGHGDYGIVHDPCPVHLTKHEQVTAGLWQEGIDWR